MEKSVYASFGNSVWLSACPVTHCATARRWSSVSLAACVFIRPLSSAARMARGVMLERIPLLGARSIEVSLWQVLQVEEKTSLPISESPWETVKIPELLFFELPEESSLL